MLPFRLAQFLRTLRGMNEAPPPNLVRRIGGWKAVFFSLGLLVLTMVRSTREHELPPMARESILLRLKADYSRPVLQTMTAAAPDRRAFAKAATLLTEQQKVQIEKATTRGILWPKYVRVEVSVNGQVPNRDPVHYFTINWAGLATSDISGFKYYCALW